MFAVFARNFVHARSVRQTPRICANALNSRASAVASQRVPGVASAVDALAERVRTLAEAALAEVAARLAGGSPVS